MKLKLKDNPNEWSKFVTVMMVLCSGVSLLLWTKEIVSQSLLFWLLGLYAAFAAAAWMFPQRFRGFYRRGMTVSFHVGQVMGAVILTVFFLVVMTPLGLVLRLCGKDLLELKKRDGASSYWKKARVTENFDRQF